MLPSVQSHVVPTARLSVRPRGRHAAGKRGLLGSEVPPDGARAEERQALALPPRLRAEVSDAPGRVCVAVGLTVAVAPRVQRP